MIEDFLKILDKECNSSIPKMCINLHPVKAHTIKITILKIKSLFTKKFQESVDVNV